MLHRYEPRRRKPLGLSSTAIDAVAKAAADTCSTGSTLYNAPPSHEAGRKTQEARPGSLRASGIL